MAYCTLADIVKLLPEELVIQLTDDERVGAVNQSRVEEAIEQADAEIDGYVGARYSVPVVAAPAILNKLSVDISIYNLYSRRVGQMPDVRSERYKNALRQLEGIAKGVVSIGVTPEPAAQTESGGPANTKTENDRVFTRDILKGL